MINVLLAFLLIAMGSVCFGLGYYIALYKVRKDKMKMVEQIGKTKVTRV